MEPNVLHPQQFILLNSTSIQIGSNKYSVRELVAPDMTIQTLCIENLDSDKECELIYALIHLLPKFHGHACEDPHKHLKQFHIVCTPP